MTDITGAKLITSAYLFGGAGFIFVTLPFFSVVMMGILKSKGGGANSGKSLDIVGILGWAFIVHFISSMLFMGIILILDSMNFNTANLYTTKIFPIFWNFSKSGVFTLAGANAGDLEADIAYTTLNLVQTSLRLFFTFLPLVLIVLSSIYGYILSSKDTYNSNYLTMFVYTTISFVVMTLVYLAWAKIASYALFMPSGDIVKLISDIWKTLALS